MLKPTHKESGSTDRERYLAKLADTTFLGLWSFPNVYTDEGISKSGIGKELCDLLVVFKNKVLIFSDKDISFNRNKEISVAWKRWFKKAIIKSAHQLHGAESWVKQRPERIFLDKRCNNKFPLPFEHESIEVHLIAVTCNSVSPAEEHWGGGSSGSLYQIYPFKFDECLEKPFIIGDLYPDKTFVHVFDEMSLDLLMGELDTVADFVNYLEEKEAFIRRGLIQQAAGEEELLAHYYKGRSSESPLGKMIHPTGNLDKEGPVVLAEGLWLEYQSEQEYFEVQRLKQESYYWDKLIQNFTYHILRGDVGRSADRDYAHHEYVIRFLAEEPRLSRFVLGTAFKEKFHEVPPDRRSSRLVSSPLDPSKLYVFLFLPRDNGQDYEDYKRERLEHVNAYALVAKYKIPKAQNIVVIATEPQMSDGRSEDIFFIEFDGDLSNEEKATARKLMKEERILNDVWRQRHRVQNQSTNKQKPYRNKTYKCGRNEKCPCGSGKKYKRCCISKETSFFGHGYN